MNDDRLARTEAALAQVRALAEDWAAYQGSHIHQIHARRLFAVLDAVK
ncbi:hypothetical protein O4273_26670 [Rhodococcus ruber]|nr:hypothetical protein [Rhodococcus ruber]MCZ4506414.1 hypothetical protein [Rhodococcus ruber]